MMKMMMMTVKTVFIVCWQSSKCINSFNHPNNPIFYFRDNKETGHIADVAEKTLKNQSLYLNHYTKL